MANNSAKLISVFLLSFAPPVKMTVAEWSARYRVIEKGNAEAGAVNLSRIPYQTEPMESFTDPDVIETALCWASQTGKTFLIQNLIGYLAHLDPCHILLKYPTADSAESFSKNKLSPMFEETPVLNGVFGDNKKKDSGNTIQLKRFKGGSIAFVGANSPSGLRQKSCRAVIQDEISADPLSSGNEGNPQKLADRRAESFNNAIFVKASTPTVKGQCAITEKLEQSDFRKWHVPCPHCNGVHALEWKNVIWDEGKPETARMKCPSCEKSYSDFERIKAIAKGRWIATKPENGKNKIRGYHLNCLYRLIGNKPQFENTLHQLAVEFLDAKRAGRESLKSFANTQLAEAWEETFDKIDTGTVIERAENYTPQTLPPAVKKITGGVDVQGDRLELFVIGWGDNEESWAVEYKIFNGDTRRSEVWDELREYILNATYKKTDNNLLPFSGVLIDSGHKQDDVLKFTAPLRRYAVFASKGYHKSGINPPPLLPPNASHNNKLKIPQWIVGVHAAKSAIYDRLTLKTSGAGFIHFPKGYGFDEKYFKQLTSEKRVQKFQYGKSFFDFKPEYHGQRNEALDTFVYALAANRLRVRPMPILSVKVEEVPPILPPVKEDTSWLPSPAELASTPQGAVTAKPYRYVPIDQRNKGGAMKF